MKRFTKTSLFLSALAVFSLTTAQAATIAWSVGSISTTDGDTSDVSTQGNLVEAVNFIGSATTLNGVLFEAFADSGNDRTTDHLITETDSAYSNAGVYNAGNTSYDTLLDGFMHDNSVDEVDYTLTGLTPGLVYEVQLFIADDRSGPDDRYLSVDSSGNTLGGNSTVYGGAANPGLVFTGTFTADATTQAFTAQVFSPTNASVGTQLGAFQLRVVSATPVATLKAGLDGADFDAASSWGEGIPPSSSQFGTITVDAINLDRATASFGGGWTINHTAGDLQFDGGWNVNGVGSTYNLSGGSITLTTGDGVSDEGNFLVNAITFNLSGDAAIEVGNAFSIGNSGSMNFLAGSGSLTAASYNNTDGTMNFVSDWTGSVTIATLDAASWRTLLATTLDGSTFDGGDITTSNFDDYFVVDGSTLSLATESGPDITAPVITLLGDNPMNVVQASTFSDPGATALDNVDGDISGNITVTGNVDTSATGAYILRYDVIDAAGNVATTATRTVCVTVEAQDPPLSVIPVVSTLKKFMPSRFNDQLAQAQSNQVDLVMIGDSITHNWEGISNYATTFEGRKLLNLGFAGDRTENVLWRIHHGAVDGIAPQTVTLMIGTNNVGGGQDSADIFLGIQAIIAELRWRLPNSEIIVFSIFPRATAAQYDVVKAVNAMLPQLSDQANVTHIDINHAFLNEDGTLNTSLYNNDQLHYNLQGYEAWASELLPILGIPWANKGNGTWETASNWLGGVAPVSGAFVELGSSSNDITLDSAFTIQDGKSLTATGSGADPELALNQNAVLTLATGGTMDIAFMRPRFNSGAQFIIEAGASLNTDIFGIVAAMQLKYIANASGVTTWFNSGTGANEFNIGGAVSDLTVDLSNYDVASGDTLILVDYETGSFAGIFASVILTEGWSGTIDYAFDQGGGDLAIALTNIVCHITGNGTQKSWLDHYGVVVDDDYEAADLLDSDSDGKFNWEEYQYGTNPVGHLPAETPVLNLQVGDISSDDALTFMPPNTAWVLQESGDLVQWDDVLDAVFITNADGSVTVSTEHDAGSSKQFYKLVETGW